MTVYVGVYGNSSASFTILASMQVPFAPIELPQSNITVSQAPVDPANPKQTSNNIFVKWAPPNIIYAQFYKYRVFYAPLNAKTSDGLKCNMYTYCGVQQCGTGFTADFTSYAIEPGQAEYHERFKVSTDVDINDIMYSIVVTEVRAPRIAVYQPFIIVESTFTSKLLCSST